MTTVPVNFKPGNGQLRDGKMNIDCGVRTGGAATSG